MTGTEFCIKMVFFCTKTNSKVQTPKWQEQQAEIVVLPRYCTMMLCTGKERLTVCCDSYLYFSSVKKLPPWVIFNHRFSCPVIAEFIVSAFKCEKSFSSSADELKTQSDWAKLAFSLSEQKQLKTLLAWADTLSFSRTKEEWKELPTCFPAIFQIWRRCLDF